MKAIHTILHDHLNVRKLCSRWISHNLTEAQKQTRVKWCKEMLKKFNRGRSNLVYKIVTGDETWIYSYEPESKQQSTVWVFQSEPKPTKIVRSHSAAKQMIACFFGSTRYEATVALEDRRNVNADCIQQFVCQKSSMNCIEQTEIVASSFNMTTPAVTQHVKSLIFYAVKMSN